MILELLPLICHLTFADPPKITISKETTYITGPLRADGMVDYPAGYNAYFKDVNPEENAAALLAQALGPKVAPKKFVKEYFRLLGMDPPVDDAKQAVDVVTFLEQRGIPWTDETSNRYDQFVSNPWSRKAHSDFDDLLRRNSDAIELFSQASRKSKYFAPVCADNDPPTLFLWNAPIAQDSRTGARHLLLRAMSKLHDGDAEGAVEDLEVCYRISQLLGSNRRFLVEGLIGSAIRSFALNAERAIAFSDCLSPEIIDRRVKRLASMTSPIDVTKSLDVPERLAILSATHHALVGDPKKAFGADPQLAKSMRLISLYELDGDEVLRTINRFYDRMVAAVPQSDASYESPLGIVLNDLEKWKREWENDAGWLLAFVGTESHPKGRRGALGKRVGELILLMTTPQTGSMIAVNFNVKAKERLTILAYRLTQWKKQHGRYPDQLDAKQLNVSGEVLMDPHADKPFAYRTKDGKQQIVSYWLDRKEQKKPNPVRNPNDSILELP